MVMSNGCGANGVGVWVSEQEHTSGRSWGGSLWDPCQGLQPVFGMKYK